MKTACGALLIATQLTDLVQVGGGHEQGPPSARNSGGQSKVNDARRETPRAWRNEGVDPSNGAFWWDGLDFKTRYSKHPKVKDGFRFSDPKHNIFGVPERTVDVSVAARI
jgi:hypothetical protein